ncbi:MAG: 3-deoxy-D-manno-octulosonic acid transferase [Gammaproteobacteria bacterium]|nr:3-deoxy-D-manno-octulosonic acid transferase [Gammaproteobacteria bacterium]
MIRLLYQIVVLLLVPVACVTLAIRSLRDNSYRANFAQRFGFGARSAAPSIWVHAVSVGEVQAASELVKELRRRYPEIPLTLTTVTPTGAARARALFAGDVDVRFVPYDLTGSVRRFFDRVQPRLAVILETELWPNLYDECGRRGVPLVLASARISPRSVGRYRLLASLFRKTLANGIVIAAQSAADAERFRSIGANPARTHVIGNVKFDLHVAADHRERGAALRAQHAATQRFVWVAGSTHDGEEQQVLRAHALLRAAGVDALLVLAPRHPPRFDTVAQRLRAQGLRIARRSAGEYADAATDVLLLDTLGELSLYYAAADVAFVGGSLVPIGGHNLLEPAALGIATLTGPHVFNAEDIAAALVAEGAVACVDDGETLQRALLTLAHDPDERARRGAKGIAVVDRNRGTLERLIALLGPLLSATSPTR